MISAGLELWAVKMPLLLAQRGGSSSASSLGLLSLSIKRTQYVIYLLRTVEVFEARDAKLASVRKSVLFSTVLSAHRQTPAWPEDETQSAEGLLSQYKAGSDSSATFTGLGGTSCL